MDIASLGLSCQGPWSRERGTHSPICETPSGMLRSFGPGLRLLSTRLTGAEKPQDYVTSILRQYGGGIRGWQEPLDGQSGIAGLELNISCPNVKQVGLQFGTDPVMVQELVAAVKSQTSLPVMAKLSPNVTDIVAIARAAERGGADCLSLINTLLGMAIDIENRKPFLANTFGGLSGPAIKPVALRMVYQVASEVPLPIMGMGGITDTRDVIEFLMAGATAVSIGTANFVNPLVTQEVLAGLRDYMEQNQITSVQELIGAALPQGLPKKGSAELT